MDQIGMALVPLITLITAQIIAIDLGKLRVHGKKLWLMLGLELLLQLLLNVPIILLFGLQIYVKWYFITMDIPGILLFFYLSHYRDQRAWYTILFTIFVSFSVSFIALWVVDAFHGKYILYNLTRILFFIPTILLIHKAIRRKYQMLQQELTKGWGMFSLLPMIGTVALYYQYSRQGFTLSKLWTLLYGSTIILTLFMVFFTFYYIFSQLHDKNLIQEQQRILSLQTKAQWEMFERQKEEAEKSNRRWHDLRFHTNNMIELLEGGDTATALHYLKEQNGMDEIIQKEYCRHSSVNGILCLWAERYRKSGIDFDFKTDIPYNLKIDSAQLSVFFANALENAFNGCLCLPKEQNRFILVHTDYNDHCLSIGMKNSCTEDILFQDGVPVSRKQGGGHGIKSMIYTVNQYSGSIQFNTKDNIFTLEAIFNL